MYRKLKNNGLSFIRRLDGYYALLFLGLMGLFACLHLLIGTGFASPSFYNTYTRQAMAWRSGSLHLPHDFPWLELAIYEGEYYVSFPPLPSVVLLPLTFLFGEATPDHLLVKCYAVIGCFAIYAALKGAGNRKGSAALCAFLFTTASSALPMMLSGAVWYHAQMMAFMLISLAILLILKGKPIGGLLLYALSVACRPFDAVYGPLLYLVYLSRHRDVPFRQSVKRLLPGTCLGLCVAGGIAVFNSVRFGNPLEFGHNYLPEFSFQGGIQFSLAHVGQNVQTFLLGSPLSFDGTAYTFNQFGYSLLIACPTISLMLWQCLVDACKREFSFVKAAVLVSLVLHIFLLLLHRTFGGFQLGARYVVDAVPYTVLYFSLCKPSEKRNALHITLLFILLVFTIVGLSAVHLGD